MTDQLSLPGIAAESPPTDGLFFAVFPDASAAERLARVARSLRAEHGLAAVPLAAERFHVALYSLGEYDGLPSGVVNAAREAASAVEASPFDVAFDRVGSFSGSSGKRALVLRGGDGLVGLRDLRRTLGLAMASAGLGRWVRPSFTPT